MINVVFRALDKALGIWDFYNKTKYQRRYVDIIKEIASEESKPIYDDSLPDKYKRDQNKIDQLKLEMKILLSQFLKEKDEKKN